MGSVEAGLTVKRKSIPRSASASSGRGLYNPISRRSRYSRFLLFKRLDYLQWICIVAAFLFFLALFQLFLPGSVTETNLGRGVEDLDLDLVRVVGEDVVLGQMKLLAKFIEETESGDSSKFNVTKRRFGLSRFVSGSAADTYGDCGSCSAGDRLFDTGLTIWCQEA